MPRARARGWHKARMGACAGARTKAQPLTPGQKSNHFGMVLGLFQRGLLVVVVLAKALQVGLVGKPCPVASVRNDMVYHRRLHPSAGLGTLPAERLLKEMCRPQPVAPDRQGIPPVPLNA